MPSPHRRPKRYRGDPLTGPQFLEVELGPKPGRPSTFASEDELREAWQANRDAILYRYAFTLHDAGWRPAAYWYFEADPALLEDGFDAAGPGEVVRLRWLVEQDAFLPGELDAMRRRARKDPTGYAAAAWRIVSAPR